MGMDPRFGKGGCESSHLCCRSSIPSSHPLPHNHHWADYVARVWGHFKVPKEYKNPPSMFKGKPPPLLFICAFFRFCPVGEGSFKTVPTYSSQLGTVAM